MKLSLMSLSKFDCPSISYEVIDSYQVAKLLTTPEFVMGEMEVARFIRLG